MKDIESAKNEFMKWLEKNKAIEIDEYNGCPSDKWEYYRHITAFIGEYFVNVYFIKMNGKIIIDYNFMHNRYIIYSIEQFLELLK